jgi:hypothetical protein
MSWSLKSGKLNPLLVMARSEGSQTHGTTMRKTSRPLLSECREYAGRNIPAWLQRRCLNVSEAKYRYDFTTCRKTVTPGSIRCRWRECAGGLGSLKFVGLRQLRHAASYNRYILAFVALELRIWFTGKLKFRVQDLVRPRYQIREHVSCPVTSAGR